MGKKPKGRGLGVAERPGVGADQLMAGYEAMGVGGADDRGDIAVYAAGGVVWRRRDDGVVEVLVVHRPRYDDWTFPKGKRDSVDESDEDCARREVLEETSLTCTLGVELSTSYYVDRKGRSKQVRYWAMTVADAEPREPDDEVDVMGWFSLDQVHRLLSYERDRPVFDSFCALVACGRL